MKRLIPLLAFVATLSPQSFQCDLSASKPVDGLKAEMRNGQLELSWDGAPGQQLRAAFAVRNGQPVVAELQAHKAGGSWISLAKNLSPEFQVTSGVRRLSQQQIDP